MPTATAATATTATTATRPESRPRGATDGPRPRGAARRELLLRATLAVIGQAGADAVTHRRVADEAGLPLASTTYYFESKEHLLTAAFEFAAERDLARLRNETGALGERPTVAEIVDVIANCGDDGDRGSLLAAYALLLEAARRPGLQALSQRWTDGYLETIAELLRRTGSARPAGDARLLIAAADGLLIDRLAAGDADAYDPRPDLQRLARALLRDAS
jgi:DNA-binding transcriptional regulator YbjK